MSVNYTAATIKGFTILNGDSYLSYIGLLDSSDFNTNNLDYSPDLKQRRDTVFLRILVQGRITLLYAYDHFSRDHFFVQKADKTLTELHYKQYLLEQDDKTGVVDVAAYKEQLGTMMADYPASKKFSEQIESLLFQEPAIKKLVNLYNNHFDSIPNKVYTKQHKKSSAVFVVSTGLDASRLNIAGSSIRTANNGLANSAALGYVFGAGIDVRLPRLLGTWSIYNEFNVRNYTDKVDVDGIDVFGQNNRVIGHVNMTYLKYQLSVRYTKPKGHIRPFAEVGMTNGLAISQYNKLNNIDYPVITNVFNPSDNRHYEQGLEIGSGVFISRFLVGLRAELSNGFSNENYVTTKYVSLILTAGYSF